MSRTVLFLTALSIECSAIVEHISTAVTERVERDLVFDVGTFHGQNTWTVAVAQTGPGSVPAGVLLERATTAFDPEVVMFVGIAGGRKDVRLGDVVVADAVYDYESGKDGE